MAATTKKVTTKQPQADQPVEETKKEVAPVEQIPEMWAPEWKDWVMSKLADEEIVNGAPTTPGLRRFSLRYVGFPLKSLTTIHQAPNPSNNNQTCATHNLQVRMYNKPVGTDDGVNFYRDVSGTCDVNPENSGKFGQLYSSATAETIAEGRAYKRLLMLGIPTKEELDIEENNILGGGDDELIQHTQIDCLDRLCKKNDINGAAVLAFHGVAGDINKVSRNKAAEIVKYVSEMQRKQEFQAKNDAGEVVNFSGYKKSWV